MDKYAIIEAIASERMVEDMVEKIARTPLTSDLKDLSQMVYVILLETRDERLQDLWTKGQIKFYIARVIMNQYNSHNSPFHYMFRKYKLKSVAIADFKFLDTGEHPLSGARQNYYKGDDQGNENYD